MEQSLPRPDCTFLPNSLTASSVGTWDYDVLTDRLRYCKAMALLYGLPVELGGVGIPMEQVSALVHPDDRVQGRDKRMHLIRHGGAFVYLYRVSPSVSTTRWVLLRGLYEPDASGRILNGRGIALDVTDLKQVGLTEDDVFFATQVDKDPILTLDRVAEHVLAARAAISELDPDNAGRLQSAVNTLLLEIGRQIARSLVLTTSARVEH